MKILKKSSSVKKAKKEGDVLDQDLAFLLENPSNWKVIQFEMTKPKDTSITMRINSDLLTRVRSKAQNIGIDDQKLIRMALEKLVKDKAS
jgi:predicted DNA binding CopG/RHH family protein